MSTRFFMVQGMEPPFAQFMDRIHSFVQECIDCVQDPQSKKKFTRSLIDTTNSWMTQVVDDGTEKIIAFVSIFPVSDNEYRIISACSITKNPKILSHMIQELMVRLQLDSLNPKTFTCLSECDYVVEALAQLGFNFTMDTGELTFSPRINFKLLTVPLVLTKIHRTLGEFLMPREIDIIKRTLRMLDMIQQQHVESLEAKWPTIGLVDKLQLLTAIARSKTKKLLTMIEILLEQFYSLLQTMENDEISFACIIKSDSSVQYLIFGKKNDQYFGILPSMHQDPLILFNEASVEQVRTNLFTNTQFIVPVLYNVYSTTQIKPKSVAQILASVKPFQLTQEPKITRQQQALPSSPVIAAQQSQVSVSDVQYDSDDTLGGGR